MTMKVTVVIIFFIFQTILVTTQEINTTTMKPATPAKPKTANYSDVKPKNDVWPVKYSDRQRHILADWLLEGCWSLDENAPCKKSSRREVEYEGYDGFYNNFARPDSGAIDRPLLRRWSAAYEDGTYLPSGRNRPNPFQLSDKLLSGDIGTQSKTGRNALLVFFGQQVVEEILDAQRPACPPEYFNIHIPENHPYRSQTGHSKMPFLRSRYDQRTGYNPNNPRQQLNEITPYLDGGLIYGITKQWADQLRTYSNGTIDPDGRLASSHDGLFPEYNTQRLPMANPPSPFYHSTYIKNHETDNVNRFFKLGNPRGNENTFLLTFGILWFKWHNYLAERLRHHHPDWSSDTIFNEARKWVIATQQQIVLNEWLPTWVNTTSLPSYSKYDPSIDPQIDQFFQSAAFRFGHTLVTPGVYLRDYSRNNCERNFVNWGRNAVRTCNVFWRPQEVILTKTDKDEFIDIDRILMGMSTQLCEKEDHKIVEDLRRNVFGPLEFPRRDLMAVNIQRGRDHGLPDYNTARKAYGLPSVGFNYFKQFIENDTVFEEFKKLYNNSENDIDPWVGGILETDDGPGELFQTVIIDQFRRIRDGDRFWFENTANGLFTANEINRIKDLSLYDIILAVTKMDDIDIPKFPFKVPVAGDESLIKSCNLNSSTCSEKRDKASRIFLCYHLPILNATVLNESCIQGGTYDYFSKSEVSFIFTFVFIGVTIISSVAVVFLLINFKKKQMFTTLHTRETKVRNSFRQDQHINHPIILVNEWVGPKEPMRPVVLVLHNTLSQIQIKTQKGALLRVIDLSTGNLKIYKITDRPFLILKIINNYDLVVEFESEYLKNTSIPILERFITEIGAQRTNISNFTIKMAMKNVVSKADRQKRVDMFFRVLFAQVFNIEHSAKELLDVDSIFAKEILNTELTLHEFAEALNMPPENDFVRRMFFLTDKDKNRFVSYREFTDLLIIFAKGNEEEKAHLLFKLYDINDTNCLTIDDFMDMLKSFLETVDGDIEQSQLETTIRDMLRSAGLEKKTELTFNDFKLMVGDDYLKKLRNATLEFNGVVQKPSHMDSARLTMQNIYGQHEFRSRFQGEPSTENTNINEDRPEENIIPEEIVARKVVHNKFTGMIRYLEQKRKEIFWLILYTLILWVIFAERAYYYSVEREHSGLRRIAGYGVTVTRGAASAMMFTYSSLLLTMCRNTITYLRETVVSKYVPFDASVDFHKYIAYWALFFTLMHVIGHAFNFYHISTQTADDLTCLFRNFFHATHELPKFQYWCWETITGITGVALTIIFAIMYIFAQTIVRRKIYNWFWYMHNLYPLFFILMILHGAGRLIQEPFFYYFFLGPAILFTIDIITSASRKKIEIPVINAEILPSNVTFLEFKKPENFEYKSGQWVRIACLSLNKNEYHPFTLSSSPNEGNLTVHIRAVGPWTMNIRRLYDNTVMTDQALPKIYLDGPYGEGHQDWNRFEVSVLIGGGIGVTPFASILKDIVYSKQKRCKKVYFIWVSRNQKQFEWLIDLLRMLEARDTKRIIVTHIYITQFYNKFDLRIILLYIFERHYQRLSEKSLFTNLRAVTHFGRPHFSGFLQQVQAQHSRVSSIGVFSCGPVSMTSAIEQACIKINKSIDGGEATFEHHYKNF